MDVRDRLRQVALDRFGYESLRPGQEDAMVSVLQGRDTLAVMPTGSGKSAIYQVPALLEPGPTVVISPLIALQKDQIDSIEEQDVASAAAVNSMVAASERRETLDDLKRDLEFLFLAPEQFNDSSVVERVRAAKPSLFVVDEAHCISEWGHDFRPDYLRLGTVLEALGHPTTLALTATANPAVRQEIIDRLKMRNPRVVVRGFDRPNIWLGVRAFATEAAKREALMTEAEEARKPGIVYVASRRHAEEIARELSDHGLHALYYHGGMRSNERDPVQDDFLEGRCDVIVATSAFGMGVDKPDVRFVFHCDIADSLDTYYQEIGRAGRDGLPARAILFYRRQDLAIHRFFKGGGQVKADEIARVASAIEDREGASTPDDLRAEIGISKLKLARALNRLEEAGAVRKLVSGEVESTGAVEGVAQVSERAAAEQVRRHDYALLRIKKMQAYAELTGCRREYLLHHFGEEYPDRCGFCDNCQTAAAPPSSAAEARPRRRVRRPKASAVVGPFPLNSRVLHKEWGKGVVEEYDNGKIVVLFDEAGKKTLSLDTVLQRGLLEAA